MAKITQVRIAKRLGLDVSSVNKILNRCAGPVFKKETIKKVFQIAKEMGYDFDRIKFRHRRRYPRRDVSVDAQIAIHRADGSLYDQGTATIRDISAGGACLSDITLPQGNIPLEAFTIRVRPAAKTLEEMELPGRVVRLMTDEGVGFGVSFDSIDSAVQRRLLKLSAN